MRNLATKIVLCVVPALLTALVLVPAASAVTVVFRTLPDAPSADAEAHADVSASTNPPSATVTYSASGSATGRSTNHQGQASAGQGGLSCGGGGNLGNLLYFYDCGAPAPPNRDVSILLV